MCFIWWSSIPSGHRKCGAYSAQVLCFCLGRVDHAEADLRLAMNIFLLPSMISRNGKFGIYRFHTIGVMFLFPF